MPQTKEILFDEYSNDEPYLLEDNLALSNFYENYHLQLVMVAYEYTSENEKSKEKKATVFEKLLDFRIQRRKELFYMIKWV
jgi:hypothetical protein